MGSFIFAFSLIKYVDVGSEIPQALLSPDLGFASAQDTAVKERGRSARRRLLPRTHKTGGRKRPIVVLPGSNSSSRSSSRVPLCPWDYLFWAWMPDPSRRLEYEEYVSSTVYPMFLLT